jgi:hypothetical protein
MRLAPGCQVILCGNEPGIREAAEQEGAQHLPEIARNDFGTPLLSDAFEKVQAMARNPCTCYVNGDIILLSDMQRACEAIPFKPFLVVGQRSNIDITELLDFPHGWEERLRNRAAREATLFAVTGLDYFLFPTGADFMKLPPFAVGRPGWDNWLLGHTRRCGVPLINATEAILALHQNHDYRHVPQSRGNTYEGPEADRNRELMGPYRTLYHVMDASHMLTKDGVRRAVGISYLHRRWQLLPDRIPALRPVVAATEALVPLVRKFRK